MRTSPRRPILRPVGHYQHDGKAAHDRDKEFEQIVAGGIDPVNVFDGDHHRAAAGERPHSVDESFQRLFFLFLRRELQRGIQPGRQREQCCEQWKCFLYVRPQIGERRLQLFETLRRRVFASKARGRLKFLNERVQRRIEMKR